MPDAELDASKADDPGVNSSATTTSQDEPKQRSVSFNRDVHVKRIGKVLAAGRPQIFILKIILINTLLNLIELNKMAAFWTYLKYVQTSIFSSQ
jgi:hypothetical protein